MKTKKILYLMLFALVGWTFMGCSSEDEMEDIGVFGAWELVEGDGLSINSGKVTVHFNENGIIEVTNTSEPQSDNARWGEYFKPSGVYHYITKGDKLVIDNKEFSWTITDNELKIIEIHEFKYNEYYIPHKYLFVKLNY